MQTPGRLKNGEAMTYAWGLQIGNYRGAKIVEHSGSLGGYRAHITRYPEHHTSFAALCNLAINPGALLRQVADVVLAAKLTETRRTTGTGGEAPRPATAASTAAAPLDAKTASAYAGTYVSDEIDATFTVRANGDALSLQRETDPGPYPLTPAGPDTFRARSFTVRFEKSGDRVASLVVDAGRVRDIRFVRAR